MSGSAMRKSSTFMPKPLMTSGNDAFASSHEKKVSCTRGQPGERDDHDDQQAEHHDRGQRGDGRRAPPQPAAYGVALDAAAALGDQCGHPLRQ